MQETLLNLAPLLLIFIIGYLLKSFGILKLSDGDGLLKVVFNISFPALIILAISEIDIKKEFAILPGISAVIIFITYFVSSMLLRRIKIEKSQKGVFLIATMIMNTGFLLPFIISAYENEGLARATIFDISNGIITYTFTYFLALKHSSKISGRSTMRKKILLSFPIWAFVLAFIFNYFNVEIKGSAFKLLNTLGSLTLPLIMLSIGVFFSHKIVLPKLILAAILIRMFIGFSIGYAFCSFIDFDEITRKTILLCSSAPIGYNTLVFSSIAQLDNKFAASLISYSVIIGIFAAALIIILPI